MDRPSDFTASPASDCGRRSHYQSRGQIRRLGTVVLQQKVGTTIVGHCLEAGTRKFPDVAKIVMGDLGELGDRLRPYLRNLHNGPRDWPGTDWTEDMSTPEEVEAWHQDQEVAGAGAESKKP